MNEAQRAVWLAYLHVRAATLEEAARIIEEHQETYTSGRGEFHLTARKPGNLTALSFAKAIRELKDK